MSPVDTEKRHRAYINIVLGIIFLMSVNACTVKYGKVPPGVIPDANTVTPQSDKHGHMLLVKLKKDHVLCANDQRYDKLVAVFDHLAQVAEVDHTAWRIHLFYKPDIVDVRAVHGNYIFVWSGFLDVAESEDEVAALLAQEMAHSLAHHTDPVKFTLWSDVFFQVASFATNLAAFYASHGIVAVSGNWTKWAYMKAADLEPLDREYSKEDEREAMEIALLILARSKYSPEAMLNFWLRVQEDEVLKDKVERLNRDLSPQERVVLIEELMPEFSDSRIQNSKPEAKPIHSNLHTGDKRGKPGRVGSKL